ATAPEARLNQFVPVDRRLLDSFASAAPPTLQPKLSARTCRHRIQLPSSPAQADNVRALALDRRAEAMIGRYATRAGFFVVTRYTPISESYTRGIEFELSFHP